MQVKTNILNLPLQEFVHPGTRACTGCGLAIAYRVGLKALGKDTILIVQSGMVYASGKERVDMIGIVLPLRLCYQGQPPAVHTERLNFSL